MTKNEETESSREDGGRYGSIFTKVAATVGFIFLTVTTCIVFFWAVTRNLLEKMLEQHFLAVVGPPLAAMGATVVLAMFRATSGEIEFKALGFEFRGASGPATLWIVCFLSFVLALRVLWSG